MEPVTEIYALLQQLDQIASEVDLQEMLSQLVYLVADITSAKVVALYLPDEQGNQLEASATFGMHGRNGQSAIPIHQNGSVAAATFIRQRPVFTLGAKDDARWGEDLLFLGVPGAERALSIPLHLKDRSLGVLQVVDFTRSEVDKVELICSRMASELEQAQHRQMNQTQLERLEALLENLGEIGTTLDRDHLLRMIVTSACRLLDTEASSIFLVDEQTDELVLHLSSNMVQPPENKLRVPAGQGIIGFVAQSGETVIVNDTAMDQRHYHGVDRQTGTITRSVLAVPLLTRPINLGGERGVVTKRIIGGLEAINKKKGTFSEKDAETLRIFASQAGTVLQIAGIYHDANDLFLGVVKAFSTAIDAKDPYTEQHSERVSEFSVVIAQQMGLGDEVIHHVRIGSLLHDLGKIGVRDVVLGKPGKLSDAEYTEMKKHPAIGDEIMGPIHSLHHEVPAMAQHHERLDGMGYPHGLAGDQISLIARIVAVADVFDAMTSNRPYRDALATDFVFEHMRKLSGTHFDPECVQALIKAYELGLVHPQGERVS
jgi:HD-GYP domain-containing protein (c-di-GMP phosphodiesterase class II)